MLPTPAPSMGAPARMPNSGNHTEASQPTQLQSSPVNLHKNTIKTFIMLYFNFIHMKDCKL